MKITTIDIIVLKPNDMRNVVTVRINTDEGISGYGELGVTYGVGYLATIGIARDYAKLLIGRDPMDIESIWDDLFRNTFWGMGGGTIINAGISGLDTALWDIKGKFCNVPVYQLIGGKTNKRIRAYASQIQFDWDVEHKRLTETSEYAEATHKAIAGGFTAVKVDPISVPLKCCGSIPGSSEWITRGKLSNKVLRTAYDRVKAIRDAGGEELDIIVELHSSTDTNTAIQLGKAIEDLNIYYYEEPVHPLNVGSMLEIRKKIDIPIASGERIYTRFGYRDFLEKRALQVIQPDVGIAGGITETKKICDMAYIYDAAVQLHTCGTAISTDVSLQIETAIPNFLIHELHGRALKPVMRELCKYDSLPTDGYFEVSERPGIGNELSEKALKEATIYIVD